MFDISYALSFCLFLLPMLLLGINLFLPYWFCKSFLFAHLTVICSKCISHFDVYLPNFLWSLGNIEHNIAKSLYSLLFFSVPFISRKSFFIPKLVAYLSLISHDFIINLKNFKLLNLFVIYFGVCQNTPDRWVSNMNPLYCLPPPPHIQFADTVGRIIDFMFIKMNGGNKGIQEGSWVWN